MSQPTFVLLIAYVILALLALLALLASPWPRAVKFALIAAVTGLYFLADTALREASGWPTREALPQRFTLLAAVVDEPAKDGGKPGAITLWLSPIEPDGPAAQPRAFLTSYDKAMHAMVDEAMKKARQGVTQMGSVEPQAGPGGFLSWLRPGAQDPKNIKITDAPKPQLPEK